METSWFTLDNSCKMATVLIALANILWIIYVFFQNRKNTDEKDERLRKLSLLKTLVLDYNMKAFYDYFADVDAITSGLKQNNLPDDQKIAINNAIIECERQFEDDFLDVLLAINGKLYTQLQTLADGMVDQFTNSIFDPGINLYVEDKFNDLIKTKQIEAKREMIKALFSYKGE